LKSKVIFVVALATMGCSRDAWQRMPGPDDVVAAVPWFSTMRKSIAVMPYQMPLAPVEGTVPITGVEIKLSVMDVADLPAINQLQNPVASSAESTARGQDRFEIYCAPCHGDGGAGDGLVNAAMFNIAPSLLTVQANGYSDGYLYTMVRNGRGIMPAHGDKIRGEDRWHVVNYIRVLQGAAQ
jgi:mono/diheme cytochrome c family protein